MAETADDRRAPDGADGDGQARPGLDLDQLRAHARLTPAQRLRLMRTYVRAMRRLRRSFVETARPVDGSER